MSQLELLNVFVNDRLTAAGDEILRAVKDALLEYQSEILRSKEENERLRRLLNVAVQRLLLLQPEPQAPHPREDVQHRVPQVKEEPNPINIQTDSLQQARDSEEGSCSHDELLQSLHPRPAENMCRKKSVSTPQLTSQGLKTESDSEDDRKQQSAKTLASSQPVHSSCTSCTPNDSSATSAKRHRTNGKQSTHILQIRNARSLKQPLPHSSHPSQSIQRWHSCKECGKGFSFACQLEVHMRWHTKEKPYSCAVCRKSFTTVSMLKRHHRIHTGEKPFRCHVCGKCFNQSAHLNTHFRLHTRERASWSRTPQSK